MTQKNRKWLFFILLLIFIAAATAGYLVWNKPHRDVQDASAVAVTASGLYDTYITDSLKAGKLYAEKVILVSGRVARITANQQSQQVILLKTAVPGAYINCTLEQKHVVVKEQDSICIKGICSGYISADADMGLPGDVFITRGYLFK